MVPYSSVLLAQHRCLERVQDFHNSTLLIEALLLQLLFVLVPRLRHAIEDDLDVLREEVVERLVEVVWALGGDERVEVAFSPGFERREDDVY